MADSTERRTVLEGLAATVMGVSALSGGTTSAADPLEQASVPRSSEMTAEGRLPTAQQMFGDVAPKFAELTDKVLFGDVWERPGLSKRDRSLVTVAALVALNRTDQLRNHLARALQNGVKKDELVELCTHLAFYSGWPTAASAILVAKDVFREAK
jgi:4-carboxymuconolactone decarboxylase